MILVVDDNPVVRKLTSMQLELLGFVAKAVASGKEAVEEVQRSTYSLVFMDCEMPDMDGFEAARRIRLFETQGKGHIPIIALTASDIDDCEQKCVDAHIDDLLTKPATLQVLKDKIEAWLAI